VGRNKVMCGITEKVTRSICNPCRVKNLMGGGGTDLQRERCVVLSYKLSATLSGNKSEKIMGGYRHGNKKYKLKKIARWVKMVGSLTMEIEIKETNGVPSDLPKGKKYKKGVGRKGGSLLKKHRERKGKGEEIGKKRREKAHL